MNPKIHFKINYKQDVKVFFAFINDSKFDNGENIKWGIFRKFPEFKKYFKENKFIAKKEFIDNFVKQYYITHKINIRSSTIFYRSRWQKIDQKYFKLVDDLFSGYKWPRGNYSAYPTIWGLYPRFLKEKEFSYPFIHKKKLYPLVVIAHEMLHFIFFDYFNKHFFGYQDKKYSFFVWNISEMFNTIVQNTNLWLEFFKEKPMPYPQHVNICKKINRYFLDRNLNAQTLISKIIEELKKSKM